MQNRTPQALLIDEEAGSVFAAGALEAMLKLADEERVAATRRVVRVERRDLQGSCLVPVGPPPEP